MHPFKHHAHKSTKEKIHSIHKDGAHTVKNLDTKGYGHHGGHVDTSSSHMQHMHQSAAPGMKKGGHIKHHKSPIASGMTQAPPSPDIAAMQAGAAGPSPSAAPAPPMPGMPMQKRGGKVKHRAAGGRTGYPIDDGQATGEARLEQSRHYKSKMKPLKGD